MNKIAAILLSIGFLSIADGALAQDGKYSLN